MSSLTDQMYANATTSPRGMITGTFEDPIRRSWGAVHDEARRMAGALSEMNVVPGTSVAVVAGIVAVADHLRNDEVVMSVLNQAPELTMVYTTERLGTSQQVLIDTFAADIKLAQEEGSVRAGEPRQLAAMCLLIARSTIQSGQIVAPILDTQALDVELAHCVDGYLKR